MILGISYICSSVIVWIVNAIMSDMEYHLSFGHGSSANGITKPSLNADFDGDSEEIDRK
jgi:hypothetical protein